MTTNKERDEALIEAYRGANISLEMMRSASCGASRLAIRTHLEKEVALIRMVDRPYADSMMRRANDIEADRAQSERFTAICEGVRRAGGIDGEIAFLRARSENWRIEAEECVLPIREFLDVNDCVASEDLIAIANLKPGESFSGGGGAAAEWTVRRCE